MGRECGTHMNIRRTVYTKLQLETVREIGQLGDIPPTLKGDIKMHHCLFSGQCYEPFECGSYPHIHLI